MAAPELFEAARHEPLAGAPWSDEAAAAAIDRIVDCTQAEYRPGDGWPAHPLDDPDTPGECFGPLYHGGAGVLLALRHLARRGVPAALPADAVDLLATLRMRHLAVLGEYRHGTVSWLLGSTGMDLLRWTLTGDAALFGPLHAAVQSNLHNPVREPLWGNAGTVLAAIELAEATAEPRWVDLVRAAADALEAELERDPVLDCQLWVQDMYGRAGQRILGAGHGFAGNMFVFLRGAALLPAGQVARMMEQALRTLQATAQRDATGTAINWRPDAHPDPSRPQKWLVQDCHGAPGIVVRLAQAPRSPAWDPLLAAAGELTWCAGPLSKGASLCHGTAGSALALLKLWTRTSDALWLDRARAMAMHAVRQVDAQRAQSGQGRHSLWTGDLGVACIVQACRDADLPGGDAFPSLDCF